MEGAGYNTFLLQNADVFLGGCRGRVATQLVCNSPFSFLIICFLIQCCADMLTDSGVNAMSDQQQAVRK